jgi:hypothetical protein
MRKIQASVPEVKRRQEEVDRALASIRELRKRTLKVSIEEILSAKEEGRKWLMPFVLGASISACWALQDMEDPRADTAFARIRSDEAVVPSLWWFEIRNILVVNERRKRITESDTGIFLRDLAGLRVRVDREPT